MPETQETREQRAAIIQANLQQPQQHHESCACCRAKAPKPASGDRQEATGA